MPELNFREAIERVRQREGAAYAFCPFTDETTVRTEVGGAGANLYVIARSPDHELQLGEHPEVCIYYVGGRYGTTFLARETYWPGKVPREAQAASYRPLKEFDKAVLCNELQIIHRELQRWMEG